MGAGTAAISTNQKKEVATPGPPFPGTSADNGLSVDPVTGRIVLGNDVPGVAAQLLNNRQIPMNGQRLIFTGTGLEALGIIGDGLNTSPWLAIQTDIQPFIDCRTITGLHNFFQVDQIQQHYYLGDHDGIGNGNRLVIDDQLKLVSLGCDNGPVDLLALILDVANNRGRILGQNAALVATSALNLDFNNGLYQLGDSDQSIGLTVLDIDDTNGTISGRRAGYKGMQLDFVNNLFALGDATQATASGTRFVVDNAAGTFNFDSPVTAVARIEAEGGTLQLFKPGAAGLLQVVNSGGTDGLNFSGQNNLIQTIGGGTVKIGGAGISTNDPGSGAGVWQLGAPIAAVSVLDATRYVEVKINGVIVKLAVIA